MSDATIPTCAECSQPLEVRAETRGRRRRYCSDLCRKRASRARRSAAAAIETWAPDGLEVPLYDAAPAPAPPDEQVAVAVLEAWGLAGSFSRLGHEARPALAWRCAKLHEALRAALLDLFPMK